MALLSRSFFAPRSIAVVGASDDVSRIGGRVVRYCGKFGFTGLLYPINKKRKVIQGCPAYQSVTELPTAADLCIVSLDKREVLETIVAASDRGMRNFVVFSSGFAESGTLEDSLLQDQLHKLCVDRDLKLLGPNSIGFINVAEAIYATFTQVLDVYNPLDGPAAIVTQSGAMAAHLFSLFVRSGIGTRYAIATGNEVDIEISDVLFALVDCPKCSVVAVVAETLRNGRRLLDAIESLHRANKVVVLLKIGGSASGTLAVRSHSAGVSGDSDVIEDILEARGVYICRSLAEIVRTVETLLSQRPRPISRNSDSANNFDRLAIITHSGGFGILMADAAERAGLKVPILEHDIQNALAAHLGVGSVSNPVDVSGQMLNDPNRLKFALEKVTTSNRIGAIAIFLGILGINLNYSKETSEFLDGLRKLSKIWPIGLAATLSAQDQQTLIDAGVIFREDPTELIEDLTILLKDEHYRGLGRVNIIGRPKFATQVARFEDKADNLSAVGSNGSLVHDGMQYLSNRHFPVINSVSVSSEKDAVAARRQLGGCVVMKLIGPGIQHKRELGLVHMNICNATQAKTAFHQLASKIETCGGFGNEREVRVYPQITDGVEVFVGFKRDTPFGPIILVGSGGTQVEVRHDIAYEIAPSNESAAEAMLQRTFIFQLLAGYRDSARYDVKALINFLVAFSSTAVNDDTLLEVDINPVIIRKDSGGLLILDAKIIKSSLINSNDLGKAVKT